MWQRSRKGSLRLALMLLIAGAAMRGPLLAAQPDRPLLLSSHPNQHVVPAQAVEESDGDDDPTLRPPEDAVEGLPIIPETRVVAPESGDTETTETPNVVAPAQTLQGPGPAAVSPADPLPAGTVVSDTRTPRSGASSGSSLSVITRDAIDASGQTSVSEVLRNVAGVDVIRSGGAGQVTSVFMRGANSNQTKVLIDGMPVNDPGSAGRAFDFSFLSVDQIDRIEVLRGPQSTLYGSDAMGGVINIITVRGEGPPSGKASLMGGSFGTFRPAASISGGSESFYYSIGGSYEDTNGFSAASRPPTNTEDDFYRNGTVSGRFGWNPSDNLNFDLVTRYSDADTGVDFGFNPVTGFIADDASSIEQENTFVRGQATASFFEGMWTHRFGAGYTQYDRQFLGAFPTPFYGRSGRIDWQNDAILVDASGTRLIATSGVDYLDEQALTTTFPNNLRTRQDNLGGFVLLSYDLNERLFLTGGSRWDDYSRAGEAFTYRFTGRYLVTQQTALHGAIGTGFRAPALAELFGFAGNPNLRREQSKGWEVGLSQDFLNDRANVDVTYFRNDFVDLIQFVPPLGPVDNVAVALTSGVEVTSLWRWSKGTASFVNYTYTDTRDRSTGRALLRRPRNKWSFGTSRTFNCERTNLTWTANYVGDRLDFGGVGDSYWLVNVAGSHRLTDDWRLFGRIDNLLDQEYEETLQFNSSDIAFYGGLELAL